VPLPVPATPPQDVSPQTLVSNLTRLLAWRLGVIVFLVAVAANLAVEQLFKAHSLLGILVAGLLASILCLPLLVTDVIRPAMAVIQNQVNSRGEAAFRAVLQAVRDGVSLIDVTGRIIFSNRAAEQLGGYAPGGLLGRRIQALASPDIAEIQNADIAAFLAGEATSFLNQGPREIIGKRADGSPLPLEISWNSLPSTGGQGSAQFVSVLRDITARKRTEAALRESEAMFRTLADTAPVMIWMGDPTGALTFVNKGWLAFRGRSLQQELHFGWTEGLHPEDYSPLLESIAAAVREEKSYDGECRMRRHDGEYRWLLSRAIPRHDIDGALAGYIGICVDVTLRKQAEDALRASERHFRELLEGLPVAVRIVQDEKVVFANQADAALHGYSRPEEEIGRSAADQVAPEEVARIREYGRRRAAGEPAPRRYEARRRRRDGSELLAESEVERTLFDGRPANLLVIRDLTDRKRVELYEKLLPVCCVCGKIRNDDGVQQGNGIWQRPDQYLALHSDAEFSHTFCPVCFLEYRRQNQVAR
jgi:PAS domain S-box-containing protein